MNPAIRRILIGGSPWMPLALGSNLIAWWDAERSDKISQSGGLVSSWIDLKNGYELTQANGTAKPTYGSMSFNGRPGITTDGVDDRLRSSAMPALFPLGADPVWLWALVDQFTGNSDGGNRDIIGYGDASATANTRRLERGQSSGVSAAVMVVGTGSGSPVAVNGSAPFNGRHLVVGKIGTASSEIRLDGALGNSTTAAVPSTNTGNVTVGGAPNGGSFFSGVINALLVTVPLQAADETRLSAYLNARK